MPIVSEFFGIKIYIYWDEHNPPHFHAESAEKNGDIAKINPLK